jgi:hypothetical protein
MYGALKLNRKVLILAVMGIKLNSSKHGIVFGMKHHRDMNI